MCVQYMVDVQSGNCSCTVTLVDHSCQGREAVLAQIVQLLIKGALRAHHWRASTFVGAV